LSVKPIDIPIIGDSNNVPQDDPEYTLNFYAEKVSDEVYTLKPTPGTELNSQFTINGGGRGLIEVASRLFGVRGAFFQEMIDGVPLVLGTLVSNAGKVGMIGTNAANGLNQILIVDDLHGYVFELATNTFTQLTGVGGNNFLGGGSQVAFCAGSAFVFKPGTTYFQVSGLNTFLTWDTTANRSATTLATPIIALASNGDLLYVFSADGFEVWQDQGLAVFPLARLLAGDKIGILAPNSILFIERFCYWLGKTSTGEGVVYKHSGGGVPVRVSNHSTERNIAALSTPSDAIGFTYNSLGHTFYGLNFRAGNVTMVIDQVTNLWHDRAIREPNTGVLSALPWVSTCVHNGQVLAIDYRDGKVLRIDDEVYTDLGNPIQRDRILSVTPKEADWMSYYQSIELFGQIGNTPVGYDDPQIMMRYSTDRGVTYGLEQWQQSGGNSSYTGRTRWVGLGAAYGLNVWFRVVAAQSISWRMVRLRAE